MEPVSIISLITAAIPFVTALVKKVFKTDQIQDPKRAGLHALIPVLIGVLSSGLYAYQHGQNWITALAIGLGSGGAASSARDIDKNLINLAAAIQSLFDGKSDNNPSA